VVLERCLTVWTVDHHINGCVGRCLCVCLCIPLSQQNLVSTIALQPLEVQTRNSAGVCQTAGRVRRWVASRLVWSHSHAVVSSLFAWLSLHRAQHSTDSAERNTAMGKSVRTSVYHTLAYGLQFWVAQGFKCFGPNLITRSLIARTLNETGMDNTAWKSDFRPLHRNISQTAGDMRLR